MVATPTAAPATAYTVTSASGAGPYTVSVDPTTKLMHCTCPARRQCWHQKAVITGLAGKPRVRIQPLPPVATIATSAGTVTRPSREQDHGAGPVAPLSD